ncbi:MAG TPA: bifunctional (p)ppGpp synthetase/guanosine-3',5'-bis(diphosphate) 3'-pyrophosphohydrolase [Spirochaetota bacterium]|nr:bifunctional (p)ppGpp synthetase/guanosine-3',5'-bis(diphosphate) 3'-pyrophosphohydrolase [Spirochaetota bacterium]HPI91019.1 bifunctional (p)ppGpp synthetase/guanosine-3',5'-bis(diphosphate) 3'-pyrophosphohydrolase [Spirochaetota bacterium]HPR48601.1 bifunctional (p)ppGpp synthetase/guanosine-3',5'-bis(diphosphate) 3'-pyrophosphohydrolase [Spirochaetota bacterium]
MQYSDLKIRSRDIETLISTIKQKNPDDDLDLIKRAYDYACESHKNQLRLSGEPYIIHPLEVALILANLNFDTTTIAAALLHDTVEDTGTTLETISSVFGEEVARLVDGVTKISSIKNRSQATAQAETLRKMLIATIRDIRVIIIKLADKLHNMRTIMFQPADKQQRIAKETMDIYAPIARRLGMSKIASELEDLAFQVLYHQEYEEIRKKLAQRKNELEEYLEYIRTTLHEKLKELNINAEITGRAKHYFSIYRKMYKQNKQFDDIYDIRAVRIITDEVRDCYGVLGVIHTMWSPVAARFKDYIAVPKSNMYQSLHTTVIGPQGFPLEVQIRTKKMHLTAEMGIAAHWLYKDHDAGKKGIKKEYKDLTLLQDINRWQKDLHDSREFMKSLKMDLYEDEIFVFTPQGKIINLAKGATPLDFAFAIHTEIGFHTVGAKVNNRMVPLREKLNSGDIVEILTSKNGHPTQEWLKFVASPNARYKIRNWLRKNIEKDKKESAEEKEKEKGKKSQKEPKKVSVTIPLDEQIRIKNLSKKQRIGVQIEGASDVLIKLSQCCQPIPGDNVIGFITRGRGITVHKINCPSLKRLRNEKERFINIVWEESSSKFYPVKIAVHALDRQNLLKDIADEISLCHTNIIKAEAQVKEEGAALLKFILEVKSNKHLKEIETRIRKIKNVTDVYKLNEKVIIK